MSSQVWCSWRVAAQQTWRLATHMWHLHELPWHRIGVVSCVIDLTCMAATGARSWQCYGCRFVVGMACHGAATLPPGMPPCHLLAVDPTKTGTTPTDVLLYCYYGALLEIGRQVTGSAQSEHVGQFHRVACLQCLTSARRLCMYILGHSTCICWPCLA